MRYIRQKPYAATYFKARGGPATVFGAIPRYKFMFYANFVASQSALALYPDYARLGSWESGVSFKIHQIDKPNVELNIQELNQYNRKRYAYTKVNYSPATIRIHDTVDDKILELWRRYFTYYFGDSRTKGTGTTGAQAVYNQYVTAGQFNYDTGYGLWPKDERYNFFDRVELYAIYGGRYTQINYINPKITRVDWQQYDSSSSDTTDMSMQFVYENIEYLPSQPITTVEANKFGFDIEQPLNPPGVPVPNQDLNAWAPRTDVFGLLESLMYGGTGLIPTDLAAGINATFQLANSTLNLFSNSPLGVFSNRAGQIVGQAQQYVQTGNTALTLWTNPSVPSNYVGTGYSVLNSLSGPLNPYGNFRFGR